MLPGNITDIIINITSCKPHTTLDTVCTVDVYTLGITLVCMGMLFVGLTMSQKNCHHSTASHLLQEHQTEGEFALHNERQINSTS